ncbi:MAG TPA: hypothetical protein PKC18_01100, partial [Lacipirellulaceae bacterium]|nr:hypothetical protein [Lacipirellulaceae bacterium]
MARPGSDFPDPQLVARPGADGAATRALAPLGAPGAGAATREFAPRGPEILTGGFNQTWLVNCLRRRWMLATLLGLLMAGLTMGMLMWLFPESSRITSYLEVKTEDDSSPWSPQSRVVSHQLIEREAQRHLALIRSPLV